MPWKETTTMEQKVEFICEWRTQKHTITELCKAFNISRPTAYKLISRFEKDGIEKDLLTITNHQVKIPMVGKISSLNVSVAAGLILFECVRQRLKL